MSLLKYLKQLSESTKCESTSSERAQGCVCLKKILKMLTGKYIKTFYLPGLRSWEMRLSTFVKYNVIENHTA